MKMSTAERASKQAADSNKVLCLLLKMPKHLFTFLRVFMLLLSFSTICLGVLCMSTNSSMCRCGNNKLVFYCLLALGLCLLVTGIFWSIFHEVLKYRALGIFIRNPSHRELHVCTIDRPDFYPPSYEDSIDPEKLVSSLSVASTLKQQEFINIPPPPYSQSSAEFISETNEQEQPPPYTLSMEQQQTADQDPNHRGGLNSHISRDMQEICKKSVANRIQTSRGPQEEQHLSKHETCSQQNSASVKQGKLEEGLCQ